MLSAELVFLRPSFLSMPFRLSSRLNAYSCFLFHAFIALGVSVTPPRVLLPHPPPRFRVEVTGIFRAVPKRVNPKQRVVRSVYKTYVDVIHFRSTESDSEVDGRGGGGASHGTAAELEKAQGGVERSRFSPARIAQFKELAADPRVYDKVRSLPSRAPVGTKGRRRRHVLGGAFALPPAHTCQSHPVPFGRCGFRMRLLTLDPLAAHSVDVVSRLLIDLLISRSFFLCCGSRMVSIMCPRLYDFLRLRPCVIITTPSLPPFVLLL